MGIKARSEHPLTTKHALLVFEMLAITGGIAMLYWHVAAYCHRMCIGNQFDCRAFTDAVPHGLAVADLDQVTIAMALVMLAALAGAWNKSWTWGVSAVCGGVGLITFLALNFTTAASRMSLLPVAILMLTVPSLLWMSFAESFMPTGLRRMREGIAAKWKYRPRMGERQLETRFQSIAERTWGVALILSASVMGLLTVVALSLSKPIATPPDQRLTAFLNGDASRPLAVLRSDSAGVMLIDEQGALFWRSSRTVDELAPASFTVVPNGTYATVMQARLPSAEMQTIVFIGVFLLAVLLVVTSILGVVRKFQGNAAINDLSNEPGPWRENP
jgi:hypothetical protein